MPSAIPLLWLALGSSGAAVGTGTRTQLAAGTSPVSADAPSESSTMLTVVPLVGTHWMDRRSGTVLRYYPRIIWRQPAPGDGSRPLFMHRGGVRQMWQASPQLQWNGDVDGAVGELDYTSAKMVLGEEDTGEVQAPVTQFASVEARSLTAGRLSPVATLAHSLKGGYRTAWIDADVPGTAFPDSADVVSVVAPGRELSVRDELTLPLRLGYFWTSLYGGVVAAGAQLQWEHRLARAGMLELAAGCDYARELDDERQHFTPTGRLGLSSALYQARQTEITGQFTAEVRGDFDRLRGVYRPLAGLVTGVAIDQGTDWEFALGVSAYTSATSEPIDPPFLETVASVSLPVRYHITTHTVLEFGASGTSRAPHWADEDFRFQRTTAWAFIGIEATTDDRGRPAPWLL